MGSFRAYLKLVSTLLQIEVGIISNHFGKFIEYDK